MNYFIIGGASLVISLLTFFSGFGLGTLLMPVFAIFFPIESAIALTGVVHLLNNIFKLFLIGKQADKTIVLRFGLPAIAGALIGAQLLLRLADLPPLFSYTLWKNDFSTTPIKLIIAVLLIGFVLMESLPKFKKIQFGPKQMPIGGFISGFFGGLSGHQGALRSAFIIKAGLSKEGFIATGVIIACFIDVSRLSIYTQRYLHGGVPEQGLLLLVATLCAFLGAFVGHILLEKVTFSLVQNITTVMLIGLALALGVGLI